MAEEQRVICVSAALCEGGDGVRFTVVVSGVGVPAFAVRAAGSVHAYLNRCGHMPMELDWVPGRFFDAESRLLICSTHGAAYDPLTGACRGGPCAGAGLIRVPVVERGGKVYLATSGKSVENEHG